MSSPPSTTTAAASTASAVSAAATYWCHECDMSILLSSSPPRCPHCQNRFLEHMDAFPPFGHQESINLDESSIWASTNSTPIFPSLSPLAAGAAENPVGHQESINRPYLHRLIHHLTNSAAGVANFYDPPPVTPFSERASRASIEGLKAVSIRGDLVECCSICKDQFSVEGVVNELPCGHVFHNGCIVPWLEISNTCPLCRFRLETEEDEVGGEWLQRGEEGYIGGMRLEELLDEGDDDGNYENEFRELMRIERGVWNRNEGGSEGGRMMLSPTQIGEAGTGGVVDNANSMETVSSWPVWQAEGEREVGTSDVENVVRV